MHPKALLIRHDTRTKPRAGLPRRSTVPGGIHTRGGTVGATSDLTRHRHRERTGYHGAIIPRTEWTSIAATAAGTTPASFLVETACCENLTTDRTGFAEDCTICAYDEIMYDADRQPNWIIARGTWGMHLMGNGDVQHQAAFRCLCITDITNDIETGTPAESGLSIHLGRDAHRPGSRAH